jgi:tellurite resistance protein TerC
MEASVWFWAGFNGAILLVLLYDLGIFTRRAAGQDPKPVSVRTSFVKSAIYVGLALAFCALLRLTYGSTKEDRATHAVEFLTGYLVEWSLSVDNIFIFVLLFTKFGVPPAYQHTVLFWGILGALVMRAAMILVGTALVRQFDWIMVVFGVFLIWSGWKMLRTSTQEASSDAAENKILIWLRHRLPVSDSFHGSKFLVREGGKRVLTPLALVLIVIELTDLLFALDSIPAIFAVTTDPFIVYTANAFAILGLRSMYFVLAGIIHRFRYLKHGLSFVLIILGLKMLVNWYAGGKAVPVHMALAITGSVIAGSIILSLWSTRGDREQAHHAPRPPD